MERKRKILVPIFNRAHYGRLRSVLTAIKNHTGLELQIIVAVPAAYDNFFFNLKNSHPKSWLAALPWYVLGRLRSFVGRGSVLKNDFLAKNLAADGFTVNGYVSIFLDGGNSQAMAKSAGLGVIKVVDELKRIRPDIVFVNADRFEMLAVAMAATYLNIPVAHNEGGDLSGTLDESVRHAITKLAHIHFTSTEQSRRVILQMGENPRFVFNAGSPAIDIIKNLDNKLSQKSFPHLDLAGKYLIFLLHPVATFSEEDNTAMAKNVTEALDELGLDVVFVGSNIDAGSRSLNAVLDGWARKQKKFRVFFSKHLPPDEFYALLKRAACAVGNSSSFIREAGYFGTPAVLVGSRQNQRERGENVMEVSAQKDDIVKAVEHQLKIDRYRPSLIFGDGSAGEKIAEILAEAEPVIQKSFFIL